MANPTLKQVISYLKYKHIISRVVEEINKQHDLTLEQAYERSGAQLLNQNITWTYTAEGHTFWENMHNEFVRFCEHPEISNALEKILFQTKEVVKVKDKLSSEVVDISEDMLEFCGEIVRISFIDIYGYIPKNKKQDGCFYYIKEDNEINAFTSEMFERIKK